MKPNRSTSALAQIINRVSRFLATRPLLKKLAWFVALYVISITVFAIFAFGLEALVPK
jgi:hypothetical protein